MNSLGTRLLLFLVELLSVLLHRKGVEQRERKLPLVFFIRRLLLSSDYGCDMNP